MSPGASARVRLAPIGRFRRSGIFGLVGVVVTAVAVAVVALNADPRDPSPKGTFAIVFAIVGGFLVLLFLLQMRDLSDAEAADARAGALVPAEVQNPALLDEATLWAAMAVRPVDRDAVRARREIWASTRRSIHTAMVVCALIFLIVPPIYLLDTFVPLVVGGPVLALFVLWKSVRLIGGGLDQAYATASRAMAPLGLSVVERPELTIEPKGVAPARMGPALHGALVLEGERHGRAVRVRMPAGGSVRTPSEVRVAVASPAFAFRARDGRLRGEKELAPPEAVRAALERVPGSTRWGGVRGGGGPNDGVVVERRSARGGDWMLDLWLAERLTDALGR
jgi:hypothetical protein